MTFQENAKQWLTPPFDEETQKQVSVLQKDLEKLEDAFYTNLSFGTSRSSWATLQEIPHHAS